MAPSTRLSTQHGHRVNYAIGSRADPIVIDTSPEPEPEPRIGPPRAPAIEPNTGTNAFTRASRRAPTRTKQIPPAKTKASATEEATHKVIKKTVKPKKLLLPEKTECLLCADTKATATCFKFITENYVCQHWKVICRFCISNMVKSKVINRQLGRAELDCPFPGCNLALSLQMLKLNMTEAAYGEYDKALLKYLLSNDTSYMACLSSDCGEYFCIADCQGKARTRKRMIACPYCDYQICLSCARPWESHGSKSCTKVVHQEEEASAAALRSLGVKPCPKCGVNIEKTGGCDHMACRHCTHHFCWECLVPYSSIMQHTRHCKHVGVNVAADPRNYANLNLHIEQVNRLFEQNMADLGTQELQRAPLAQVHPTPIQPLPRPTIVAPLDPQPGGLEDQFAITVRPAVVRDGDIVPVPGPTARRMVFLVPRSLDPFRR
ncbi:hypothetical protein IAQ61_011984 [Plenodomus lingam]|uniref:uncharacterized protein n=1 Tax=Leptosphaeria maculans TaxID=5022 RepID=UPI003325BA6D|nr:hypothetical protein IAQ61_011984 [Plenodomus lingam]